MDYEDMFLSAFQKGDLDGLEEILIPWGENCNVDKDSNYMYACAIVELQKYSKTRDSKLYRHAEMLYNKAKSFDNEFSVEGMWFRTMAEGGLEALR